MQEGTRKREREKKGKRRKDMRKDQRRKDMREGKRRKDMREGKRRKEKVSHHHLRRGRSMLAALARSDAPPSPRRIWPSPPAALQHTFIVNQPNMLAGSCPCTRSHHVLRSFATAAQTPPLQCRAGVWLCCRQLHQPLLVAASQLARELVAD